MTITHVNFVQYLQWSEQDLIRRYSEICTELAEEKFLIASMKGQEHRGRVDAFWDSTNSSIAARNRAADSVVMEVTSSIMERQGTIDKLTEERFFIEHLMDWKDRGNATRKR